MRSRMPGWTRSSAGPAMSRYSASDAASETARRACVTPCSSAAIAAANSACSRSTRSGRHSAHAERIDGSIARTLSVPKISPITILFASSGGTVGTRAQTAPSSSSGGAAPSQNG